MEYLLGKTLNELHAVAESLGMPRFTAKQLAQWLYEKRVRSIDAMTNISKAGRERLSELYDLGVDAPVGMAESSDGTRKYLFPVSCPRHDGFEQSAVEAVMIPDDERRTLCVSSQAGCKMGCRFCMTGRQGFHGNLTANDLRAGKKGYGASGEVDGALAEVDGGTQNITTKAQVITAPAGIHDGTYKAQISATEQAKIIAANIKKGVTILGVAGGLSSATVSQDGSTKVLSIS